jgi:integrase
LDAALKHAPRYYPLLLCDFRTGLRFGDLLGLQWNGVDERERFIEVRRKEQMGHSSIKITVDTYGHLVPGSNRAAVDRLDTTGRNPRATGTEMHAKEAGANSGVSWLPGLGSNQRLPD